MDLENVQLNVSVRDVEPPIRSGCCGPGEGNRESFVGIVTS